MNKKNKTRVLLNHNCISKSGNRYQILPISWYNKTTYYVEDGTCTCQGYKRHSNCAHVYATKVWEGIDLNWVNEVN